MNSSEIGESLPHKDILKNKTIFLSASFPSLDRSREFFENSDPDEITQALVSACRAIFSMNGRIVFGGHPSVTPLVMLIAEEYLPKELESRRQRAYREGPLVIAYQSEAFGNVLPESMRNLTEWALGELRWVKSDDERPVFSERGTLNKDSVASALQAMRRAMLSATDPVAAIFIGGMEGIYREYDLFKEMFEGRPVYFLGGPGGAARHLSERQRALIQTKWLNGFDLSTNRNYPSLLQRIVMDIGSLG